MIRNLTINKRESLLLDGVKLFLTLFVVYGHMLPFEYIPISLDINNFNYYDFLREFLTRGIPFLINSGFSLLAGYFFFLKMEHSLSFRFYKEQLRKRIKTVLVPYILWNLLLFFASIIHDIVVKFFVNHEPITVNYFTLRTLYDVFIVPINFPFWFVRDIICMSIVSPLFYFLFRYTKIYGLILLYILYITNSIPPLKGFSDAAIFYFGIGVYLSLNKINIVELSAKLRRISYIIALIGFPLAILLNSTVYHIYIIKFSIPFGLISLINSMGYVIKRERASDFITTFTPASLFIIGLHMIYILPWAKGAFARISVHLNNGINSILFILIPIAVFFICYLFFVLLKKVSPKTLSVLVGGRA